jgi:hypothetical protein
MTTTDIDERQIWTWALRSSERMLQPGPLRAQCSPLVVKELMGLVHRELPDAENTGAAQDSLIDIDGDATIGPATSRTAEVNDAELNRQPCAEHKPLQSRITDVHGGDRVWRRVECRPGGSIPAAPAPSHIVAESIHIFLLGQTAEAVTPPDGVRILK